MSEAPRLPNIGEYVRNLGRLVAVVEDVPPPSPPPTKRYVFEVVSARVEILSMSGVKIDTRESLNDFFGEGSAVTAAIKCAREHTEKLAAGFVVVVVRRIVERQAMRPTPREHEYHPYCHEIRQFDHVVGHYDTNETSEIVWRSDAP